MRIQGWFVEKFLPTTVTLQSLLPMLCCMILKRFSALKRHMTDRTGKGPLIWMAQHVWIQRRLWRKTLATLWTQWKRLLFHTVGFHVGLDFLLSKANQGFSTRLTHAFPCLLMSFHVPLYLTFACKNQSALCTNLFSFGDSRVVQQVDKLLKRVSTDFAYVRALAVHNVAVRPNVHFVLLSVCENAVAVRAAKQITFFDLSQNFKGLRIWAVMQCSVTRGSFALWMSGATMFPKLNYLHKHFWAVFASVVRIIPTAAILSIVSYGNLYLSGHEFFDGEFFLGAVTFLLPSCFWAAISNVLITVTAVPNSFCGQLTTGCPVFVAFRRNWFGMRPRILWWSKKVLINVTPWALHVAVDALLREKGFIALGAPVLRVGLVLWNVSVLECCSVAYGVLVLHLLLWRWQRPSAPCSDHPAVSFWSPWDVWCWSCFWWQARYNSCTTGLWTCRSQFVCCTTGLWTHRSQFVCCSAGLWRHRSLYACCTTGLWRHRSQSVCCQTGLWTHRSRFVCSTTGLCWCSFCASGGVTSLWCSSAWVAWHKTSLLWQFFSVYWWEASAFHCGLGFLRDRLHLCQPLHAGWRRVASAQLYHWGSVGDRAQCTFEGHFCFATLVGWSRLVWLWDVLVHLHVTGAFIRISLVSITSKSVCFHLIIIGTVGGLTRVELRGLCGELRGLNLLLWGQFCGWSFLPEKLLRQSSLQTKPWGGGLARCKVRGCSLFQSLPWGCAFICGELTGATDQCEVALAVAALRAKPSFILSVSAAQVSGTCRGTCSKAEGTPTGQRHTSLWRNRHQFINVLGKLISHQEHSSVFELTANKMI